MKLRHEINLLNGTLSATSTDVRSTELYLANTSNYSGTITTYFEVLATNTATSSRTVGLAWGTGAGGANLTIPASTSTFTLFRTTNIGDLSSYDRFIIYGAASGTVTVKAARLIIIQDTGSDPVVATESQFEIGNRETGKTNTVATALSSPKYWKWEPAKWDGKVDIYAEAVHRISDSMYSMTVTLEYSTNNGTSWNTWSTIVGASTATSATRTRISVVSNAINDGNFSTGGIYANTLWRITTQASNSMATHDVYAAKIVVSQSEAGRSEAVNTGSGGWSVFGVGGTNEERAQAFTLTRSSTIKGVKIAVNKTESPTDNLIVELAASTTGTTLASGTLAATSVTAAFTSFEYKTITFTTQVTLASGVYYVRFSRSGSRDIVNHLSIVGVTVAGEEDYRKNSGSWEVETGTGLWFMLQGDVGISKMQEHYLLANTPTAASTFANQKFQTTFNPAEWDGVSNSYRHVTDQVLDLMATGYVLSLVNSGGTALTNSGADPATGEVQTVSGEVTMPTSTTELDIKYTGGSSARSWYASRMVVSVTKQSAPPGDLGTATLATATTLSATLKGNTSLAATGAESDTLSATLKGTGALSATMATATTLSATGEVIQIVNGTANLATATTLTATVKGLSALSATLATSDTLSATIRGTTALACTLATATTLSATLAGMVGTTADLATASTLTATLKGTGTLACSTTTTDSLASELQGIGFLAATLSTSIVLAASPSALGALDAALTTATTIDPVTAQAIGAISATLATTATLTGTLSGLQDTGVTLTDTTTLTAVLGATGSMEAGLAATSTLTGQIEGIAALLSALEGTTALSATLSGTGALSAAMAAMAALEATLSGAGALEAQMTDTDTLTAAFESENDMAATLATTSTLTATLAGTAATGAGMATSDVLSGILEGKGALSASLQVVYLMGATARSLAWTTATLADGPEVLTATLRGRVNLAPAAMVATTTLAAQLQATGRLSATLQTTTSLSAAIRNAATGSAADMTDTGTLTAALTGTGSVAAALSTTDTLSGSGRMLAAIAADLTSSEELQATLAGVAMASAALSGGSTLGAQLGGIGALSSNMATQTSVLARLSDLLYFTPSEIVELTIGFTTEVTHTFQRTTEVPLALAHWKETVKTIGVAQKDVTLTLTRHTDSDHVLTVN